MAFNRPDQIEKLGNSFDLCVIGGGASGAGIALDASLRGYRVLLIEKGDFASQTSSKSTKLVHGGVRYLEQAVKKLDLQQLKMVYKALHERKVLLKNASHLSHPLGLITPCYSWIDRLYYRIGMWMYDLIAGKTNLRASRGLHPAEMKKEVPGLDLHGIKGGILYYDGQMNDARYALAILQSAEAAGACILNYASFTQFIRRPNQTKIEEVVFSDLKTGDVYQIPVKCVINATGPFTDHIRTLANPNLSPRMKVSRGAHIVLPMDFWPGETSLLIPKTDDGRVIFVIPWRGYVLVGTTDDPDELHENPQIQADEKAYLLSYFNRYSVKKASLGDITSDFVGQRPLLQSAEVGDTKSLVRDHEVELDASSHLVSILGGKWTTYRVMAEDTMQVVEKEVLGRDPQACTTKDHILFGGESNAFAPFVQACQEASLLDDVIQHLWSTYGSNALKVLQFGTERFHADFPYLVGEIDYMKKHEMATSWADVLERRWGIALQDLAKADQLKGIKKEAFAS